MLVKCIYFETVNFREPIFITWMSAFYLLNLGVILKLYDC